MIEVFRTDVLKPSQAQLLTGLIGLHFPGCRASFDLEDCDKVLRVVSGNGVICNSSIISLLESHGYRAEVLGEGVAEALPAGILD